jgi:hypothetical protein
MPNAFMPDEQKKKMDARVFFSAVADGDAAAVTALLTAGAHADASLSPGGETPLMRAASRGYTEVVRVLLDAGADVNAQRTDGFTPLILAVFFGHEEVVRLLVERNADASAQTRLGMTASRWASSRGFAEMAGLLRRAIAASPRAVAARPLTEAASTRADAPASRAKVVTLPSDEVSIFSRKGERREAWAAFASTGAGEAAAGREDEAVTDREDSARKSKPTSTLLPPTTSAQMPTSARVASASAAGTDTANVSVRSDARVPTHPSASTFRLGHFLRSWQGSLGTALLLLAFGVAVFALWRGGTNARQAAEPLPAPSQPAPQSAAQPPAPSLPTPQPSPVFPTPDAQAVVPVPDPAYAAPYPAGQPYYVPPVATSPGQSNAPRDLVVVSEGGTPSGEDAGHPKRKKEADANDATSDAAHGETRNEPPSTAEDSRATRSIRPPETEPRSVSPARPSTPPAPEPSATPARAKVIQWPPQ